VRHLVRTGVGLVLTFAVGLLVAYIGLAVSISGRERFAGILALVVGLWLMVYAPVVHDRAHREAGEGGHAVWGKNDR
jgi:high-affinity Fe2+/Pb2+ permease